MEQLSSNIEACTTTESTIQSDKSQLSEENVDNAVHTEENSRVCDSKDVTSEEIAESNTTAAEPQNGDQAMSDSKCVATATTAKGNGDGESNGDNNNVATALIDLSCNDGQMPENWKLRVDANPVELADAAMNNANRDLRNRISSAYDADDQASESISLASNANAMNSGSGAADPEYESILNDLSVRVQRSSKESSTPDTPLLHSVEVTNDCFAELSEANQSIAEPIAPPIPLATAEDRATEQLLNIAAHTTDHEAGLASVASASAAAVDRVGDGKDRADGDGDGDRHVAENGDSESKIPPNANPNTHEAGKAIHNEAGISKETEDTTAAVSLAPNDANEHVSDAANSSVAAAAGEANVSAAPPAAQPTDDDEFLERAAMFNNMVLHEYYDAGSSLSLNLDELLTADSRNANEVNPAPPSNAIGPQPNVDASAAVPPNMESSASESASSDDSFQHDHFDHRDIEDDESENISDSDAERATLRAQDAAVITDILSKPKPDYNWNLVTQIRYRENGLTQNGRVSIRNGSHGDFQNRYYGSRQVAERLRLIHKLTHHEGCVNCLNFNRSGDLLCSGSDDMCIIVWNWAQNKIVHQFRSGHTGNIFQVKFLNNEGTDIVSSSYDGQIRRSLVPNSGRVQTVSLYRHRGPVHKIVICPGTYHEIISVGEDCAIRYKDLRTSDTSVELFSDVTEPLHRDRTVRLFGVSHHPYKPEICVCGSDCFVRVFDKRYFKNIVHKMCPQHLLTAAVPQVTCCVYNYNGSEVLATYGDECIYLFNNQTYKTGDYMHRYRGHYNHRTIKGVNFFGLESEYIVSGSDCGHIFLWDKNTEAIVNYVEGDELGAVNCLEAHPRMPVLATSGLEHKIKLWVPMSNATSIDAQKLEKVVKHNLKRGHDETGEFNDRLFHYFIRRFLRTPNVNMGGDDDSQSSSSSSSGSSTSDEDHHPGEGVQCPTQ